MSIRLDLDTAPMKRATGWDDEEIKQAIGELLRRVKNYGEKDIPKILKGMKSADEHECSSAMALFVCVHATVHEE